jgi:hypothetical protein
MVSTKVALTHQPFELMGPKKLTPGGGTYEAI